MTTGDNIAYSQPLRSFLPEELRRALLCWYPFRPGARALYLGDDPQAHLPRLREYYRSIDVNPDEAGSYDCIFVSDWTGSSSELDAALAKYGSILSDDGVLLLGFRNRMGLKYLCGGIDDAVSVPLQSLRGGGAASSLRSRAEMERALERSPFEQTRFYSVMPDAGFAQAVYSDDYLPQAGIRDRVFPYDPYNSPFLIPESSLYDTIVQEGVLSRVANYFIVECRLPDAALPAKQVMFAALSADRGEKDSFATIMFSDDTARKVTIYPEGRSSLQALFDNGEALRSRGIKVVEQQLTPDGIDMPFVHAEPMMTHIDRQLAAGRKAFFDVFRKIEADVLKSSAPIEMDDEEAQQIWGVSSQELGPVLERGFIDMIPYNSFWSENGIIYYDQEFSVDRCPVGYVLFRALRYTYIHLPHIEQIIPLDEAKSEFGLERLWGAFMKREDAFVGANRNWQRYHQIYDWAGIRDEDCQARCEGLLASHGSFDEGLPVKNDTKHYGIGLLMGVFDLFHVGHLRLIKKAKAECDYLRVGVLTDELVMEFKNHTPVIPLEERMEVIAAIAEVDEVVAIEGNPSRIMEWHKRPFDCFFSGDDYVGNPYWDWEREELRKLGSDIRFFPYTQEQSSSKIRGQLG